MKIKNFVFPSVWSLVVLIVSLLGVEAAEDGPVLVSSSPANFAMDVSVNTPVVFVFNTAMAPAHSVQWSGVDGNKFTYTWSSDGRTLTAVYSEPLPANALITWMLNAGGLGPEFTDVQGTPLEPEAGFFMTGAGGTDPDDDCPEEPAGPGMAIWKIAHYQQQSASAPSVDPELRTAFMATVSSPEVNRVTAASIQLPDGSSASIPAFPFGGIFMLVQSFSSETDLEAAFPPGEYRATLTRQDQTTETISFQLGTLDTIPIPQIANFPEFQQWDPAGDFTVHWNGFTGAAGLDSVIFEISSEDDQVFLAPDPCVPRELPPTATSVVIPGGAISATENHEGTLSFIRMTVGTGASEEFSSFAAVSRLTRFGLNQEPTGEHPDARGRFIGMGTFEDGAFHLSLQVEPNVVYLLQASIDLNTWETVQTSSSPTGTIQFSDEQADGHLIRFYRTVRQ
jgi:hypothetical protein